MFNGRLQPQRAVLAVSVLFLGVIYLGLVAGAGWAGETPAITPPSTGKVKIQTRFLSSKLVPNQATVRPSGKMPGKAAAKRAGAESPRTTVPTVLAAAAGRRDPFRPTMTPAKGGHSTANAASGLCRQAIED